MSKKNKNKKNVAKGQASAKNSKDTKKEFELPKVNEAKNPQEIKTSSYVVTVAYMILAMGLWTFAARSLFPAGTLLATVLVAVLYFVILASMYIVRATLETRRRYSNKPSGRTLLYYSQMVKSDQKWQLYIGMAFFAVSMVLRWLFRTPNFDMVGIDIASCFYLGYLWTCKYKGEENIPFQYMETVFLLYVAVSNYVVYFIG